MIPNYYSEPMPNPTSIHTVFVYLHVQYSTEVLYLVAFSICLARDSALLLSTMILRTTLRALQVHVECEFQTHRTGLVVVVILLCVFLSLSLV